MRNYETVKSYIWSQKSGDRMKRPPAKSFQDLILAKDLGYIETRMLISQLEEVSKLLDSYSHSILTSVS